MKIKKIFSGILIGCLLWLSACGQQPESSTAPADSRASLPDIGPVFSSAAETTAGTSADSSSEQETLPPATETQPASTQAPAPLSNGKVICIDAGHQAKANTDKEPVGPGSSEMKTKVSSGTQGRTSGVAEYVVNLQVALKLQAILEARGYEVLMIRTTHDVDISNVERAKIANEAGVDAFVRLHCNGVDNTEVNGILAVCQTASNPWIGSRHDEYYKLCISIVNAMCEVTGAKNMGIQETDTMTGINWCEVPTALVEMGFMTNPEEDLKLADDAYQDLLAEGVANGLDAYFGFER